MRAGSQGIEGWAIGIDQCWRRKLPLRKCPWKIGGVIERSRILLVLYYPVPLIAFPFGLLSSHFEVPFVGGSHPNHREWRWNPISPLLFIDGKNGKNSPETAFDSRLWGATCSVRTFSPRCLRPPSVAESRFRQQVASFTNVGSLQLRPEPRGPSSQAPKPARVAESLRLGLKASRLFNSAPQRRRSPVEGGSIHVVVGKTW